MCAHQKRSSYVEFVFILLFSFDVVVVILRGESNCWFVSVYNWAAYANETVLLALMLFFFVYMLSHLYFFYIVHSVTACFLHAVTFRKLTRLACYVQWD